MRVLIVEDNPKIAAGLQKGLQENGFAADIAHEGFSGEELAAGGEYDVIILDLMLPGVDGLSICRDLRKRCDLPILMLTAKSEDIDRVLGLEMGADDYLTKPFNPRELLARVRAILRRTRGETKSVGNRRHAFERFVMDLDARTLQGPEGEEITLKQ